MNEFIVKAGNTPLPDVFLLLLAKHHLNERDCVSLAVSGASDRFSFLFWLKRWNTSHFFLNYFEIILLILYYICRKRLVISQYYFLTPMYCDRLFQKHFSPLSLTSFDTSHGYWIPAKTLANAVVQMHNLEELSCQDTKLSLVHLLQIFKTCKKILKLSFTLLETNLDAYHEVPESFLEGFCRVTHLKIFTINQSDIIAVDSWRVTLVILRWFFFLNLHHP